MSDILLYRFMPGSSELVSVGPPTLLPAEPSITLSANDSLRLECHGGFALEWKFPTAVTSRVQETWHICGRCNVHERHQSTIVVENPQEADSGLFKCIYSKHLEHQNNATMTSISVVVDIPESKHHMKILMFLT